jgi:DNA processing protein
MRTAETAWMVALLRHGRRGWNAYAGLVEAARSARPILEEEHGLLTQDLVEAGSRELAQWREAGIRIATVLDPDYPENLRAVHDRPPLIFTLGELLDVDARSVAVIGSRQASESGVSLAQDIARNLVESRYTVVSGLARGIDTAAHAAALERGGRTVAVIGTGLHHCYPRQNVSLQRLIADRCAVVSQFWPETGARSENFPRRNAVMSGLSLATVIVEAGARSGARTQARFALAHGRPVLLMRRLLEQEWAQELARRPGVHLVESARDIPPLVEHLSSADILVA